jgi:DNA-binding MarR family transcriptional regulator
MMTVRELDPGELDSALRQVREHPGVTAAVIGEAIGVSRDRAKDLLRELERAGKVRRQTGQREVLWYEERRALHDA